MNLGDRIQIILKDRQVKQVDFAKTLGISANYANLLAKGKKDTISFTLAKLIEETYGFSAQWLINGVGDSRVISACKAELLKKVKIMNDDEIKATLAFAITLDSVNTEFITKEATTKKTP